MRFPLFARRPESIGATLWAQALAYCPYARALGAADGKRLRALAEQFIAAKSFDGVGGFQMSQTARTVIALKACVPILNLGMDYYAGWSDIVVYPTDFRVVEEYTDYAGVVHRGARDLCGQSMSQGPMVLSWDTIAGTGPARDRDVVVHECAHKLDILNGAANGFPPLHKNMSAQRWSRTFHDAYAQLVGALQTGDEAGLDPYAATAPAEFFAVISETFFTQPATVYRYFRPAYDELAEFYRQDPVALLGAHS